MTANKVLTLRQEAFCAAYLGEANGNATKAAAIAGYGTPKQSGSRELTKPLVQARIEAYREELRRSGIASKERQLAILQADFDRTSTVIEERAADAKLQQAAGGATGIVTRKWKSLPNPDPTKPPIVVTEDSVDTGLLSARANLLKQAAQVAGWWTEKREVTGKEGGAIMFTMVLDRAGIDGD